MRELNQKILSDHGLNWDTFKELKQRIADTAVGAIETEYGTLDIAEEPFYLHKNSEPLGNRKTIRLRRTN